jgi:hypothetical protein
MRLKDWKTKPMFSLRTLVSRASLSLAKSVPDTFLSSYMVAPGGVGRARVVIDRG